MLFATLTPSAADISWLLSERRIPRGHLPSWLALLIRRADQSELAAILADAALRDSVLSALPANDSDLRRRILAEGGLPLSVYMRLLFSVLPHLDNRDARELAGDALARCIRTHFGDDELAAVKQLLDVLGSEVDGGWVARHGLEKGVQPAVASRNLLAFHKAAAPARRRLIAAVEDIARAIAGRYVIDINRPAIEAFAELLADANHHAWPAALAASGRVLPLLMRSRREPVSSIVAVAFPAVYRELAKADDVPAILNFIPFLDWDRCKSARYELVSAFLSSSTWEPGDLALTICRCGDIEKILGRIAKSYGGSDYINRIAGDTGRLSAPCKEAIKEGITHIRAGRASRYD